MRISNIVKDYGDVISVVKYKHSVDISPPICELHSKIACRSCFNYSLNPIPSPSSLMRTKAKITDYVLSNNFTLFLTFTIDPKKIDSYNHELCKTYVSKWLNNTKRHSPDLQYILVPELHKSGRIHFHALVNNYKGELIDSGRIKNGRTIYNLKQWRYGYSTAVKISDKTRVAWYMQKYITKEMLSVGYKKRYWASRNLNQPTKNYNQNLSEIVYSRPLFVLGEHNEEYYTVYTVLK